MFLNLIKKQFMLVAMLGLAITFFSFKSFERRAPGWYEVNFNASTGEHDLTNITSAPSPEDDCQVMTSGELCKVEVADTSAPPTSVESAAPGQILQEAKRNP